MRSKILFPVVLILLVSSCKKEQEYINYDLLKNLGLLNAHLKIAVVSDIHYMHPSLLQNHAESGTAFQDYLNQDPKLLEFSDPIFKEVITEIKAEKPDILLVPGDLTKDGEPVSHNAVATFLKQLEDEHIKVYVVPGNHDVNNPEAASYNGNNSTPIASISADQFASIYARFGYEGAISRDPNSLSYVSQPWPGLWILGIDDCKYSENTKIAIVGGKIKPGTMKWIQARMAEAEKKHIMVLGMMHHNLIEHYNGQNQFDPGYVTDDWEANADKLIAAGLTVIFTGHYHANDITKRVTSGKELYDIETGSLVTAPIPYRIINFKNKEVDITTKHVTSIPRAIPYGLSFPAYSNSFLSQHLDGIFSFLLTQTPFSLEASLAAASAPLFRKALMAHYAGDEKVAPEDLPKIAALGSVSPAAGFGLSTLWTDLAPADNTLHITLLH